ncbi:MAG: hypothetical protein OWU33_16780, partial [Firmicutes bacterium]|nr:hypothetical protein [Bacillota bacterium]
MTLSAMPGSAMSSATVASATSQYAHDAPSHAIDGNLATAWSSGAYTGTLTLTFSSPMAVLSL